MITTPAQILGRNVSYSQLLATQEWKDFSNSIRRDSDNACAVCKRKDVQTQVHHFAYEPDKKPWEYTTNDVVLLCKPCHQAMHVELTEFRRHVFRKLTPRTLHLLNDAMLVGLAANNDLEFAHAVAEMAASPRSVTLFAHAWENRKPKTTEVTPSTTP